MGALKDRLDKLKTSEPEKEQEAVDLKEASEAKASMAETPKPAAKREGSKSSGPKFYRKTKKITEDQATSLMTHYERITEQRQVSFDSDVMQALEDFKSENTLSHLSMNSLVYEFLDRRPEMFQVKVAKTQQKSVDIHLPQGIWGYLDEVKAKSGDEASDSDILNALIRLIAKQRESV